MKKRLLIILTFLSFMILTIGTVNAEELKPIDEEALNLIDDTYKFDIKESEIDFIKATDVDGDDITDYTIGKQAEELENMYKKILKEHSYDVSDLHGFFGQGSSGFDIHKYIIMAYNSDLRKEITISYSNTDQYNEEDKKIVEKEVLNLKGNPPSPSWFVVDEREFYVFELVDSKEDIGTVKDKFLSDYFSKLIDNKDIMVKVALLGMGTKTPTWSEQAADYLFFKNDILYAVKKGWFCTMYGFTMHSGLQVAINNIDKENDLYSEMVENSSKKLNIENIEEEKILGCYELEALGETEKNMEISFDIDPKYNDYEVNIIHKKKDNDYELYQTVVKDGKATIKVNEFSPFMIVLGDKKAAVPDDVVENNTPNKAPNNASTGTMNVVLYSIVASISLVGIVGLIVSRKKKNN